MQRHDFGSIDLPFCDVALSGLTISPGGLIQSFDPYRAEYTVAVGPSRVTVVPTNDHNASFIFLDVKNVAGVIVERVLEDADDDMPGFQVDFSPLVPAIKIIVVSEDGLANHSYTVTDLGIQYDANDDGSIDRDEVIEAIKDYFTSRISRDETIAVIKLYFSR